MTHPNPARSAEHRRLRLLCLEALYREIDLLRLKIENRERSIETLTAKLQQASESAFRGIWMMRRLMERAGTEEFLDLIEQVHIDAQVAKQIDPDFSFAKAINME